MIIEPSYTYYGARIHGIDFSKPMSQDTILEIRKAWIRYQVISFPNQQLTPGDLERIALYFGDHCADPFIKPIENYKYVARIHRAASEQTKIFAEHWHSDWFHMKTPPAGTMLYAVKIPPTGGDTWFSDLYESYTDLPERIKNIIKDKFGINSAQLGYAPDGAYGEKDKNRSMDLFYNESAYDTELHPLTVIHPESNKQLINCNLAYTIGIEDMQPNESTKLLNFIFKFQLREKYIYRYKWSEGDLVIWDNRCVLHRATGGYNGHERLLYRITIQ